MSLAGEKRYRVEILLLSHTRHEAVPSEVERLRDFSDSLDFLKAEDDAETENDNEADYAQVSRDEGVNAELISGSDALPDQTGATETGDTQAPPGQDTESELFLDEDQPKDPWADVLAVEDLSAVMQDAWRRLRLSAPFRPEQYLSWEQSADEPFPLLRIHDLEVVLIDDPYADLREIDAMATEEGEEGEEEGKPVVFSDQGSTLPANTSEETAEESAEEPELPDAYLFYRIDGTVMLRRSRFLHLDLDLELRQAVFDDQALARTPILNSKSEATEPELPVPTSFLIHALKLSRQVKSQRMEYFDSPVLGVLAWITPFEIENELLEKRTLNGQ